MKKKLNIFDKVIICIVIICFVIALLIPTISTMVLFEECCNTILFLSIGIWLVKLVINIKNKENLKNIIIIVLLMLVFFGVATMNAKDILADIFNGEKTIMLSNFELEKRSSKRGIFSLHYYLKGTDNNGKEYRFKISGNEYEKILRQDRVSVKGFENTGRVVELVY